MKKLLFLSLLVVAVSCKTKKTTEDKTLKPEVEKSTEKKKDNELLDPTQDLIVVLKNPELITETKELISNSGLKWDKTLLDQNALKIGLIKIPANRKDYWLDKLIESGEFKHVRLYSEKNLKELIEKEKKNFLSIRKTPCFGECPVYEVTVDKEGNVTYNGIKYVTELGERKFKLTEKEFEDLKKYLNDEEFSGYESKYDNPEIEGLSSTYITYKGKQIQVRVWKDAPEELMNAHEYFEGILLKKKFFE